MDRANSERDRAKENTGASPEGKLVKDQAEMHRRLTAEEIHFADSFTRVMSVLMKSEPYRRVPLGEIEHFVAPPLLSGQFAILDGHVNGRSTPVAVAFWALVSEDVDKRLTERSSPIVMGPRDWRSGDILWLVDVFGEPQAVGHLMVELHQKIFADRVVKIRSEVDGQFIVSDLCAIVAGADKTKI